MCMELSFYCAQVRFDGPVLKNWLSLLLCAGLHSQFGRGARELQKDWLPYHAEGVLGRRWQRHPQGLGRPSTVMVCMSKFVAALGYLLDPSSFTALNNNTAGFAKARYRGLMLLRVTYG